MGQTGLKPLSFAFKQIEFKELVQKMQNIDKESDDFRNYLESQLIYLGTFGLDDPISENVHKPIQMIRFGHNDDNIELRDNN